MKPDDSSESSWKPEILDNGDTFIRTLDHVKIAFAHTQDVIKFVDSKCNVLTALTTAISGFALTLAKWNFELPKASAASFAVIFHKFPWTTGVSLVLFLASLVASVVCIAACLWGLIARSAPNGAFTVLFPVPRDATPDKHLQLIGELTAGMSSDQVMREFNEQLRSLGGIAQKKIGHSKIAARAAAAQIGGLSLAIILYVILFATVASKS